MHHKLFIYILSGGFYKRIDAVILNSRTMVVHLFPHMQCCFGYSVSSSCLCVSKHLLPLTSRAFRSGRLSPASCNRSFYHLPHTEVACRGERVRDFYQRQQGYAACQTEEKVSRLECRGSCPGGAAGQGTCCTPLRSKRRKYTFQCTDGSSFVQEVEKVVKCGCTKCSS